MRITLLKKHLFHSLKAVMLYGVLLIGDKCFAQTSLPESTIDFANQINLYGAKNQSPVLYIHFDKNVYSTNESVWFTAYLLNIASYQPYKTLSLMLVKDDDRAIVSAAKFIIKNGKAFGNTTIPDTIPPGNYTFIASVNRLINKKPEIFFSQPVTIKSEDQQEFTASLSAIDTV